MIAKEARVVIADVSAPETRNEQKIANFQARLVVQDVLDSTRTAAEARVAEIWKLANVDPDLEHAVNVSTFAVLFAMAFGRVTPEEIADLALAGLLHDVGLSQVPASITSGPWINYNPRLMKVYASHVEAGLALIEQFAPEVPARVKAIILAHHEKFDGTGYPKGTQGFKLGEIPQLLQIADMVDSISSGRFDGIERTLQDTLNIIQKIETSRTFPEYFNPEVFAAVMRFARKPESLQGMEKAIDAVANQARGLTRSEQGGETPAASESAPATPQEPTEESPEEIKDKSA